MYEYTLHCFYFIFVNLIYQLFSGKPICTKKCKNICKSFEKYTEKYMYALYYNMYKRLTIKRQKTEMQMKIR